MYQTGLFSKSLYNLIDELLTSETLPKTILCPFMGIEDKYELIRMESPGLLRIEVDEIFAHQTLIGCIRNSFKKTGYLIFLS